MGKYWLHDLPAELAKLGIEIELYPGWELRSRSSGGLDGIYAVCMHHTASTTKPENDMAWQWRNSPISPIGNISLHRDGTIVLGAAGAANTQGAGGPYKTSKGWVPKDAGNRYMIAIEACQGGTGEYWTTAQLDAYVRLVAALCEIYNLDPTMDVLLHATYTTRKIDAAGPTPKIPTWGGLSGAKTWNLEAVRRTILEHVVMDTIPDSSSFRVTNPVRIFDTIHGSDWNPRIGRIQSGQSVTLAPRAGTRQDAKGVILNVSAVGRTRGNFVFWNGVGAVPEGSSVNCYPGIVQNNMIWVPMHNGRFWVTAGGKDSSNDLIVDQIGWYW